MELNERAAEILAAQLARPGQPDEQHVTAAKAQVDAWRRQNPVAAALLTALAEAPAAAPVPPAAAPVPPAAAPVPDDGAAAVVAAARAAKSATK